MPDIDSTRNQYAVVKKGGGIWFARPIPESMPCRDALFFAAYIVAAVDRNGYEFARVLREIRRS